MDVLKPGHAHRSSSDRLLNNYLDSQKSLSTSLLTLLSHSHSSTSSLLAYVTSSPGVIPTIRRSVRHAAFEGPLSSGMTEGSQLGSEGEGGWAAYISSLDQFRKDLKQIHLLEEEISRVKRDREILVGRLIKATKGRPTKSDLSALATTYNAQFDDPRSSRASVMSDSSSNTKAGKREGKLADAQAELLGCEEHLRGLEVRIEAERNKVMTRGLEQRFRAMEVVGRMWVQQAKRGLSDLDMMQDLPPDAFELDSNGSLAPSQSASQVAYDDVPRPHSRGGATYPRHLHPEFAGSIDGSIAEENEDSSDEDMNGLQVHENHPGQQLSHRVPPKAREQSHPSGVPSIIDYSPKLGDRRAASDIGTGAYRPTPPRQSLLRTVSHDRGTSRQSRRAGSDTSSIREHKPKKKGFFTSIRTWFKGGKHHGERSSSPPYGSGGSKAGWQTRTDGNIKRGSTLRGSRPDESSSDESEGGNFVSVSNNQNSTWAVDHHRGAGSKVSRTTSMPLATGLIPSKPAKPTRSASQSTITAKPRPKSSLSRSGTVKSAMSDATVKSSGGTKKRTRPNGSIARSTVSSNGHHSQGAGTAGKNIMSLVDSSGPVMPEVPKAPRSGSNPNMHLPSAPGTSIVTADARVPTPKKATPGAATSAGPPTLGRSVSQKSTASKKKKVEGDGESEKDDKTWRPTTPLPPSRLLSPPLKSALRPTSPSPSPLPLALQEPVKPMYSISAPAPVPYEEVKQQQEREQLEIEEKEREKRAQLQKRNSYVSVQSDGASVYESAYEDEDQGTRGYGPEDTDSSDDEDGDYQVIKNEKHIRRGEMASGDPDYGKQYDDVGSDLTVGARSEHTTVAPTGPSLAPALEPPTDTPRRRKSVRMAVPDSPVTEIIPSISPPPTAPGPVFGSPSTKSNQNPHPLSLSESQPAQAPRSRTPSPEPERVEQQWSTRIGRMREDTSDEEDDVPDYVKARKKLQRNSGKWEVDGKEEKKERGLKKKGSVKGKGVKKLVKA